MSSPHFVRSFYLYQPFIAKICQKYNLEYPCPPKINRNSLNKAITMYDDATLQQIMNLDSELDKYCNSIPIELRKNAYSTISCYTDSASKKVVSPRFPSLEAFFNFLKIHIENMPIYLEITATAQMAEPLLLDNQNKSIQIYEIGMFDDNFRCCMNSKLHLVLSTSSLLYITDFIVKIFNVFPTYYCTTPTTL